MKFGLRIPSLKRRIAVRTSCKRVVRHSMGLKAPRGMGFVTNPERALYNKTLVCVDSLLKTNKTPSTDTTTHAPTTQINGAFSNATLNGSLYSKTVSFGSGTSLTAKQAAGFPSTAYSLPL